MRLVQRAPVQNSRQIYSEFSLLVLPREENSIHCEIHNGAEGIRKLFPSSTSTAQGELRERELSKNVYPEVVVDTAVGLL